MTTHYTPRPLTAHRLPFFSMTTPTPHSKPMGVRLGRRAIHQLRASLERDTGLQAAAYLQEAGFAGGEELFATFSEWLSEKHGVEQPSELDVKYLGEVLGDFFTEQGWGRLDVQRL